ncbi:obtusifoliol 14-alpha demethylase-like [Lolium rigidum]|jgi:sterol 14-demethylase|nr:obtusifoliol 14-alpha demethylase-like [Lolium rigidum]
MDLTSGSLMFVVALLLITTIFIKISQGRILILPACPSPTPPVVSGLALLGLLPMLSKKGLQSTIYDLYTKLGSVFTISFFGPKLTFLIGPEVSAHFFQGLDSDISHGNLFEFTVPMFGKETGYGVDINIRNEQARFYVDALKPSMLRRHVGPMLQEVEEYFAKWGQEGVVDIKQELDQLVMFIASRCLLGKEVREKMFDEFFTLFHQIEEGVNLISFLFPYIPIPTNRRRNNARLKMLKVLSEIVRSRKSSNRSEDDTLQRLIDSKYRDGRSTTEAEVTGTIIGLIFAGKHTSSHTSTWTGACLLSDAKFLTAAIEEQRRIISKYGECIDYNALSEMVTLHSCIKETLRLHPPAPMLVRKAHKNFSVRTKEGREYVIPKGHTVASPVLVNNIIPYIYKDPEVYDPDRFSIGREEDKAGGKFSYTSFSAGRHVCTGEAYAYQQIKVIWSNLLRNFELKLVSPFPKTDWSKFLLEPHGKVMVSYKRRAILGA